MKYFLFALLFLSYIFCLGQSPSDSSPNTPTKNTMNSDELLNFLKGKGSVTSAEVRGIALSTGFQIPPVKYHLHNVNDSISSIDNGTLSYFNSAGVGIGITLGKVTFKNSTGGKLNELNNISQVETEMANIVSLNLGFLFSGQTSDQQLQTSFAPVVMIGALDIQLGWGYELGNVDAGENRHFYTISYNIPLSKLSNKGSILLDITNKDNNKLKAAAVMF
jgi:hypothetical protein